MPNRPPKPKKNTGAGSTTRGQFERAVARSRQSEVWHWPYRTPAQWAVAELAWRLENQREQSIELLRPLYQDGKLSLNAVIETFGPASGRMRLT